MKRTWTLGEIVAASRKAGSHYFDRGTMRYFGQRMRDFHIRNVAGRTFVWAPAGWDGLGDTVSFSEFNPETGRMKCLAGPSTWTRSKMEDFLAGLVEDETRKCRWCGRDFKPKEHRQVCCGESCYEVYRGWVTSGLKFVRRLQVVGPGNRGIQEGK